MEKNFFALFLFLYYIGLFTQSSGSGSWTSPDLHLMTRGDELNPVRSYLDNSNVYFKFINDIDGLIGQYKEVALITYIITAISSPESGGTILGAGTYNSGETASLAATANKGYHFMGWWENNGLVSPNTLYFFTVGSNRTLVAKFALNDYLIEASVSPEDGGTISWEGSIFYGGYFLYGQNITFTATPNTGYDFVNWTENGTLISTNSDYNFTVISEGILIANFMLSTAVENQRTQGLDIYPNPAHDYINICSTGGASLQVKILDFSGRILLKATDITTIDLSNFKPGTYIVNINGNIFKMVKD